jgi:quercetin dioxygenase-like cupin family protein
MERGEFMEALAREGFPEAVEVVKDSAGFAPEHTHPFEAKALILAGDMRIRVGDVERVYHVGDIFHLQAGVVHAEHYGEHGVTYLVGRKVHAPIG